MFRSVAIAALVTMIPTAAGADCAMSGLAPKVVTPTDTAIPSDGGIVVIAESTHGGSLDPGDAAIQATWQFRGAGKVRPAIVTLAPGLAVYRLPAGAGAVELEDDHHKLVGAARATTDKHNVLAAPKIKTLGFDAPPMSRRSVERVVVELDGLPPPGAVALVIADAKGTPRSWGLVDAKSASQVPYKSHSCVALPNGTVASKAGDQVILHWVDAAGRRSAATRPLAIAAARTPAP